MDKNKIIEAAAKLVAKGAYDKAIKEYQKILEADPKDVRILQKVGELHQKRNESAQAAQYFSRVAETYTSDGFFLKAVALYKQVLKLDPSLIEVNLKLAELHQQLQLTGEAMAYLQLVANHWDKQGDVKRSLEVLRKMVDLDPSNVASRVKLADLYVREGMHAEALAEFSKAAQHLKELGRTDDYFRVVERISGLEPNNLKLAKELAQAYLDRNDQKRALAKLQVCFKADHRDIETLRLLAVAFQGLGQISKTISVFKELARVYEEKGAVEEAADAWAKVAQLDPNDADALARNPAAPVPDPGELIANQPTSPTITRPKSDNLSKLLTETDVYVKYGLHDKALEHLRKVFSVEPENLDAHEKAYSIYVAANNRVQAFEQLLNVLRLHTRAGASARAQPYIEAILQLNSHHPEVPVFLSVLRPEDAPEPSTTANVGDDIVVDSDEDEVIVSDEILDVASDEVRPIDDDAAFADAAAGSAPEVELAARDAEFAAEVEVEPPPVADAAYEQSVGEQVVYSDFDGDQAGTPLDLDDGPTGQFDLVDEPALRGVENESDLVAPPEPEQAEAVAAPLDEPAQEECDEAAFFIDQALFDEAREILETVLIAYPEHQRAAALLAQIDALQSGQAGVEAAAEEPQSDAFDLAAELANELGDAAGESLGGGASDEYQVSVDEVFAEFKKGLEKVVKPEDVDTHYDLGVAYKEMGLIDDAVGEFSIAHQGCQGKPKEIDCLSMMGMLQLARGDVAAAVDAYQQALASSHAFGEVEKSLRYELAGAFEAGGWLGRALGQYLSVQAIDGLYRDVGYHVDRLSALAVPEDDQGLPLAATSG